MKKQLVFFFVILLILACPSSSYATNNPRNMYDVKYGDTLWRISMTYETSVENLKLINGLQSNLILVGQRLRVPISYEVVSGDTLWSLAKSFSSTVQLIKTANGLTSNLIYVGQKIKIPPKELAMQGKYVLMTREEFKDWIFNHKFNRKVRKVQLHHTLIPSYQNFNGMNHFAILKGMEDYHVSEMKWSTISQQLITFPDGKVAVCRPFDTPPEGSFGLLNESAMHTIETDSLAIENIGNFDENKDQMSNEQKQTIIMISALLMMKYDLTPSVDSITYHHWWDINSGERVLDNAEGHAIKTCPGNAFFGGNSTTDARNNFYPLVSQKMQEILHH